MAKQSKNTNSSNSNDNFFIISLEKKKKTNRDIFSNLSTTNAY